MRREPPRSPGRRWKRVRPAQGRAVETVRSSLLQNSVSAVNLCDLRSLTKSHFLRLDPNRRLSGSLRRDAPFLLTRIARVDSLVSQLIRDLEGGLKLAVRQVTVCLDDG